MRYGSSNAYDSDRSYWCCNGEAYENGLKE